MPVGTGTGVGGTIRGVAVAWSVETPVGAGAVGGGTGVGRGSVAEGGTRSMRGIADAVGVAASRA